MEGACYPRGGSEEMAKELVPVIESFGGRVLIRAQVEKILVEGRIVNGFFLLGVCADNYANFVVCMFIRWNY